jgi:Tfp pilus assembly protein PilX
MIGPRRRLPPRLRAEHGFTMIIALGVMFVTSLLLVAAFTAVNGDINTSHENVTKQQAYYAALAGVQEYEYKLEANSSYWENCEPLSSTLESGERFEVTLLPAEGQAKCNAANPFETEIESSGAAANTFRIMSVGCAGAAGLSTCSGQSKSSVSTRSVVATFKVTGFLDYVYFTQYEDIDPALNGTSAANCTKYYEEKGVKRAAECVNLVFTKEDSVNGPMHTDDAAQVTCSKELNFGREKQKTPPDTVEINGGTWPSCSAGSEPTYYTESKTYSKGVELVAPESDESLGLYVESANKFAGATHLILQPKGVANQIEVTVENGKPVERFISWPANGLLYVEGSGACGYNFNIESADTSEEEAKEEKCGTVYVEGSYTKSLTIAGTDDVIIKGNIYPTSVSGKLGTAPTGAPTLGLIATNFVRVYHPCSGGTNQSGYMSEPFVYAAILSTSHSFVVDNYKCGAKMNNLNVYGAIAQKFRGPVGQVGTHGYTKEYVYDSRLETEEPPYFLSPLKTGWKVARETAPTGG